MVLGNHMQKNEASQDVLVIKNPPANAGNIRDLGLITGLGRSPRGAHGKTLQYSCLGNHMDRGTCSSWGCKKSNKTVTEHSSAHAKD